MYQVKVSRYRIDFYIKKVGPGGKLVPIRL
jgi:hypothetical protein